MPIKACVFDAYGTLFDVAAAARIAAAEPEHAKLAAIWPQLAEIWRTKQLQYTWLRACLLYTSPSPRDLSTSRMPSSA